MPKAWRGVFPAVTTTFRSDETIDVDATARHIGALIDAGVHGIVALGTVGEGASLNREEKLAVLTCALKASAGRVPVLAGVAEATTADACAFSAAAAEAGADGLMVLPAMIYKQDPRETVAHFHAVGRATPIPKMVYNNPPAYGVDITPAMLAEIASDDTYVALKEASGDSRRLTDIVNLCGDRFAIFCGIDDTALENFLVGAVGWVAGLTNAFPKESVALFDLAKAERWGEALAIYRWFMPLLHLDATEKLVQNIKLACVMTGQGSELMRRPRLPLHGAERSEVETLVRTAIETRPSLA